VRATPTCNRIFELRYYSLGRDLSREVYGRGLFTSEADDGGEFGRVALRHLGELVRTATRVCGREAAEDVVQETYLRAWQYWHSFEPGTNCRAWLYAILFNVIRKRRGGADPMTVSIEAPEVAGGLPSEPPPSLALADVENAFARLPEHHREALLLVAVEGFSYKEAAEILDIPIGTLMSRLHRGREALRHLVEGMPPRARRGESAADTRRAI
jgi:RNA polymerase sigma-70 factor (ECF subfamily)